jgi:predicted transposase YbfD/YdcC
MEAIRMTRTLWDALGEVPDGRGRKGRQIALPSLLAVSIAAMLSGADSLISIFRWGRRLQPEALRMLGFPEGLAPCHATYHYVFLSIDGDALSRVLGKFALGDQAPGHIAIDGKTLKGSRRHDARALHVLSAFSTGLAAVVGDLVVEPDQNEITAALALLKSLPLEGAIITGDAIFCQRQICQQIRDGDGHYLFSVKSNQPALHTAIAESFGDLSPLHGQQGRAQPRRRSAA